MARGRYLMTPQVDQIREQLLQGAGVVFSRQLVLDQTYWDSAPGGNSVVEVNDLGVPFECSRQDFVAVVGADWTLGRFQEALAVEGFALPHGSLAEDIFGETKACLADLIALNEPHLLMGSHGTWSHWLLGATVLLADGTLAKSGSRVTKSVAGFDAHTLVIGSRNTLLLPVQFIFRVVSRRSMHSPTFERQGDLAEVGAAIRVLPGDFQDFKKRVDWRLADARSSTLWVADFDASVLVAPEWAQCWAVGAGRSRPIRMDQQNREYWKAYKRLVDPRDQMGPGVLENLIGAWNG